MDERTEQLINRRLDGELREDESLELDKRLIRSPQARQALEVYERNDADARDALDAWLRPALSPSVRPAVADITSTRGWASRIGIGVRAVAAAVLLATMVGFPSYWRQTPQRPVASPANIATAVPGLGDLSVDLPPVIDGPREETHQLQRNIVGIWDETTQSVYVLELDQQARKIVPTAKNF